MTEDAETAFKKRKNVLSMTQQYKYLHVDRRFTIQLKP